MAVFSRVLLFVCLLAISNSTESMEPTNHGDFIASIDERGLLTEEIDPHVILEENARYSENTQRKVTGDIPVLGFVTPWNSHGYDIAKLFNNKFTHISPCWFQIRRRSSGELYVAGTQDIDQSWMTAVRSNCVSRCPKIVPRFVWEAERLTWDVAS